MLVSGIFGLYIYSICSFCKARAYSIIIAGFIYFIGMLFKLIVFIIGFKKQTIDEEINDESAKIYYEKNIYFLPKYTILLPIFKETKVTIDFLLKNINNIYYPKSKLDIKILIEETDKNTIELFNTIDLPTYMSIVIVKNFGPQTKARASNYALLFATGDFLSIYDAEDIPDRFQLIKAVMKFEKSPENCAVLQGILGCYNEKENLLTKFFSTEYKTIFSYLIPGYSKLQTLVPLGGTSNHFKMNKIAECNGWDPFNVTEDAELGCKLSLMGFTVGYLKSTTMEECPRKLSVWLKQRTRWMKGYIQTYVSYFKIFTFSDLPIQKKIPFHLIIGFGFISFIYNPINLIVCSYIVCKYPQEFIDFVKYVSYINMFLTFFLSSITYIITSKEKKFMHTLKVKNLLRSLCYMYYFIFHIIAVFRALYQLFFLKCIH